MDTIELRARALAAKKMNLSDPYGRGLPDDLWQQALPEAVRAYRFEVMQKLRGALAGAGKQGYHVQDWQLAMWVRWIDEFKAFETPAERDLRLAYSSTAEMTPEELDALDRLYPGAKDREAARREQATREANCPGHEAVSTAPAGHDHSRGWHPAKCKHCGKDMSVDSGD